jgi:hypothetical protein
MSRNPALITEAIEAYGHRIGSGDGVAPYDAASLGTIFGPRVAELEALRREGFTRAEWRYDHVLGVNHWVGV